MSDHEQYVEGMSRRLDEWNKRLKELREQVKRAPEEKQRELKSQVDIVESKAREMKTRVKAVRSFTEDQWKELTLGVDRTRHELETALKGLSDKLKVS